MTGSDALERFIRWVMRDTTYHGTYPCTVMGQAGELCEVIPDSPKLKGVGGLSAVPIRHGLPGCSFMIAPGARVLLAFDDGDPAKPYVALWENATLITLMLGGGTMPVARVGDTVMVTVVDPISGPLTGTGIIAAGSPKVLA